MDPISVKYDEDRIYTVVASMPSNSHNALCDVDGYYWPRGLYVQDVTDKLAVPWFDTLGDPHPSLYQSFLAADQKAGRPSRLYQVLGYEETIIMLPDSDAQTYLYPGRYCPRCDMDKDACRHSDEFDAMAAPYLEG